MSWKKTTPYFWYQALRYAPDWGSFRQYLGYYKRWRKFLAPSHSSVHDELPWLSFLALDFLEKSIRPGFRVFEYGGGGSTLYFCRRAAEVVTVEDNPGWYATLTQKIAEKKYQNWKGFLIEPVPFPVQAAGDPANPDDFCSGSKGRKGLSFERYARAIDTYPAAYFDLVLVDGRSRPSCIQQAIPHIKPGGLLVVDNTERPYYLTAFLQRHSEGFSVVSDQMSPIGYTPDFVKTSIFKKQA